ncbi:MAG: tRNA (adenosine(37)-N6)-dimethylallyltransferase MiaA [Fibrobacteria bacterium]|nr:tRNA (adenosine(37)-N6)-dimethylallyltransferase MiaA [Fibrobacteria bacterium]
MVEAIICGPTAAGKSKIAFELAKANGFEIISADSRQIYKGLEIGTAQVSQKEQEEVPHHFMGFLLPSEPYSVNRFRDDVMLLLKNNPEKRFIIAGGTGLYIRALLYQQKQKRQEVPDSIKQIVHEMILNKGAGEVHKELAQKDPQVALKIHPNDKFRIAKAMENLLTTGNSYQFYDYSDDTHELFQKTKIFVINQSRECLYKKINERTLSMIEQGWVEEVKTLLKAPNAEDLPCLNALGYKQIVPYVQKQCDLEIIVKKVQQLTRNFAKKQITFFKSQLKNGEFIDFERFLKIGNKNCWKWTETLDGLRDS